MRGSLLVAAAVLAGALASAPARAQFDNLLNSLITGGEEQEGSSEPAASNLNETTSGGTDLEGSAVALVEDVQGEAGGLEIMDYVYGGQQVALGQGGSLVLSHLDGCIVERISGGTVTVRHGGSTVAGGAVETERLPDCMTADIIITADAREAGATVNRLDTPFDAAAWREEVTKSDRPTFVWERGAGKVKVRVVQLDAAKPKIIWARDTDASSIAYPMDAPALVPGLPYRVEVQGGGGTQGVAFMVDPGLDTAASSLAGRVVTLVR